MHKSPSTVRLSSSTPHGWLIAFIELEDDCASVGDPVSSLTVSSVSVDGAPTVAPGGTGPATSVQFSLPVASGSGSQSIFFSSSGAPAPTAGSGPTAPDTTSVGFSSPGATNTQQSTVPHSTVGPSSPSDSPPLNPSSGANNGGTGVNSGMASFATLSSIALAGAVGGVVLVLFGM